MPTTRKTSGRKKSEICNDENGKENVNIRQTVRESKVKALKKIEENIREESPRFTVKGKDDADAFDMLCSSPLKQEVNFKPLSFWSKKVKDLEGKENGKKKKIELYELSESDDSSSVEGKRTKKRGRPAVRRCKNTGKKANKVPYQFNMNLLKKKVQKNKVNENKEGSIIRERIILQRLNDNCLDKKDKFSFNKVNMFGLTSTPGRSQKLNIVGGSTFDFLSPIAMCENKLPDSEMNSEEMDINKSVVEENFFKNETFVTPRKSDKKELDKNVVTKDLKRVSENELPTNVTLVGSNLEMNSFPKNFYVSNYFSTINRESSFQAYVNTEDAEDTEDLHHVFYEENQFDRTFLNDCEDEDLSEEDDISNFKISEYIGRCCDVVQSFNSEVSFKETDMFQSLVSLKVMLKILCTVFDYDIDTTVSSQSSFAVHKFQEKSLFFHNKSVPLGKDQEHITIETDKPLDLHLGINDSAMKNSSVNAVNENSIRNSAPYVQVRRPCNFFLNFRGSAREENFNLSFGETIENCKKKDSILQDITTLDYNSDNSSFFTDDSFKIDSTTVKENFDNLPCTENKACMIRSILSEESTVMEFSDWLDLEDQQTHMDYTQSNITVFRNRDVRSNQYCSRNTEVNLSGENKEIRFTLGNDSSVVLSTEEEAEDDVDCSICQNQDGESRKCSKNEISHQMIRNPSDKENTPEFEQNNVTCFRVIGGLRVYKKQTETKRFEENESSHISLPDLDRPVVKNSPVENAISTDMTFNDESDFPLPIFESTACRTPDAKKPGWSSARTTESETGFNKVRVNEVSETTDAEDTSELKIGDVTSFHLKPGKKWAKSAIILKKALNGTLNLDETCGTKKRGSRYRTLVEEVLCMQNDAQDQNTITSSSIAALTSKMSNLTVNVRNFGNRTVKVLEEDGKENSFQSIFRNNSTFEKFHSTTMKSADDCDGESVRQEEIQYFSARDLVLMRCNQEAPLPFDEYFNEKTLKNCKKIGEGAFGEVFMSAPNRVIKIVPIEGPDEVNGEPQKKFDEIITEMVIAMELSNLRQGENYRTSGFSELKRCWCVFGEYPQYLIDLWNDFDCTGSGSENDSPEMFKSDQLYIILEFANGGRDLESFVFTSAEQSYSIFVQVAFSLAVAERLLEFEHRDMHWGNVLINHTREKYFKVTVNGKEYKIPTKGVKVTIIDFTLSRISYDGCSIFNDLSLDLTLFTSEGDYQFEIYRMMKEEVMNDWSLFKPRTNLFWLHYVLDKMLTMVRYKKTDSKIHKINLIKFSDLKSLILDYRDSEDFILNKDLM